MDNTAFIPSIGQLAMHHGQLIIITSVLTKDKPVMKREKRFGPKVQVGTVVVLDRVFWHVVGNTYPEDVALTHDFSAYYRWKDMIMEASLLKSQFKIVFDHEQRTR